ncbi:hypothetical protein CPB83DRAFT_844282 [Crepidotus variabilis]|uniref:Uncharacterized protein n=1 Tax=Crepidotus variabilis TaxID=179855 RepID=A0A9P6ETB4_9AGAR|nr:hypothetical protein CPB83DRAFT_844282 [Crepidotus variabilis]
MEPPPPKISSKPPLITPSASPPPTRYSSVYYRDSAPPNKRQRTATPRRTFHDSASSSNSRTQTPVLDVQKEREASMSRLLDVWAGLADRYCRDDEEDDIVDINTGEIITDNGFLRNTPALMFGSLAGVADEGTEADEEEEDEYDPDELDAWADVDSEGFDLHGDGLLDIHGKVLSPVTNRDPSYAADLREFLEAEKQRKPIDEDPDPEAGSASEGSVEDGEEEDSEEEVVERVSPHQQTTLSRNEDEGTSRLQSVPHGDGHEEGYSDYLVPLDVSGDELDNWEENESNAIQTLIKEEDEAPTAVALDLSSDSEIEIIDGPFIPKSNARDKKGSLTKTTRHLQSTKPPLQLYTPPQSNSSDAPSSSPVPVDFNIFPHTSLVDSQKSPPALSSLRMHLQTNTNSAAAIKNEDTFKSTPPKLDLAQVQRRKTPQRHSSIAPTSSGNIGDNIFPPSTNSSPRKLKPVVEITVLKLTKKPGITKEAHKLPASSVRQKERPDAPRPPLSKGKGKEKEIVVASTASYHTRSSKKPLSSGQVSEECREGLPNVQEENNLASLESGKPRKKSPPVSKSSTETLVDAKSHNASPRKRKRVVSDTEDEVDTTAQSHPGPSKIATHRVPSLMHDPGEGPSHWQHRPPSQRDTRRKKRKSPSVSDDDSASEVSEHFDRSRGRRSQSRSNTLPPASHYLYPHGPYMPHPASQPIPAIHDPRAQLIIAQAMHQLSTLVGAPWPPIPSYLDGEVPHTPSRRGQSMQPPNFSYATPTHHPHPYSYAFDPSFSRATLPPDTPEASSSPEKSGGRRPKTLVRRSRSRGRNVSFRVDDDDFVEMEERSSSPMMGSSPLKGKRPQVSGNPERSLSKTKAKPDVQYEEVPDSEESEDGRRRTRLFTRGQTPGPNSDGPEPLKSGRS